MNNENRPHAPHRFSRREAIQGASVISIGLIGSLFALNHSTLAEVDSYGSIPYELSLTQQDFRLDYFTQNFDAVMNTYKKPLSQSPGNRYSDEYYADLINGPTTIHLYSSTITEADSRKKYRLVRLDEIRETVVPNDSDRKVGYVFTDVSTIYEFNESQDPLKNALSSNTYKTNEGFVTEITQHISEVTNADIAELLYLFDGARVEMEDKMPVGRGIQHFIPQRT